MAKKLTVKELADICAQQIRNGNGDKEIFISQDDEGNAFHGLYFTFTELNKDNADAFMTDGMERLNYNRHILLG